MPVRYEFSANRDLINEGRGFLVPRGEVRSAISVLRTLAADGELLKSVAMHYQKQFRQNYSVKVLCKRLDEIIQFVPKQIAIQVAAAPFASPASGVVDDCPEKSLMGTLITEGQ